MGHDPKVRQNLIRMIVDVDQIRKDFLANQIIARQQKKVGVFCLVVRANPAISDSLRSKAL